MAALDVHAARRRYSTARTPQQITPLHPGPHPMKDPVGHLTMITSSAAPPVAHQRERSHLLQLAIRQTLPRFPPHDRTNAPDSRMIDRAGTVRKTV